jgi:putative ABC transport system permease protein
MNWWRRHRQREEELEQELATHLDMAIADRIARGEPPREAEEAAVREFGNRFLVRESVRRQWGWAFAESLMQDARYGFRVLRSAPGVAILAILALSLGIGAATVMFSVVYGVLLNPFPYPHGDRLVAVSIFDLNQSSEDGRRWTVTSEERREFERGADLFEGFVSCEPSNGLLEQDNDLRFVKLVTVSPNTFEFIGIPPKIGRVIRATDGNADSSPVAVLSEPAWRKYFGADPAAIGRTITLDHRRRTVIGVVPKRYAWWTADVWVPQQGVEVDGTELALQGRLKPGVRIEQANEQLTAIGARLKAIYPERYPKRFQARRVYCIDDIVHAPFRRTLYTLLGAVGFLLLIACSNAANMLLSRATARQREISLRMAIGAGRLRIVRQLVIESALLALFSAIGGVAMAYGGIELLPKIVPSEAIAQESIVSINLPALLFALSISVFALLIFGLAPAWQLAGESWGEGLRCGTKGSAGGDAGSRLRDLLVVVQIGLALVLLNGAGLFARSLIRSLQINLRVDPLSVVVAYPDFPSNGYHALQERETILNNYVDRLRMLPGVMAATRTSRVPAPSNSNLIMPLEVSGVEGTSKIQVTLHSSDWAAKDTFGYRLLAGRWFTREDVTGLRPVAVINDALARAIGGAAKVVGKRVRLPHGKVKNVGGRAVDALEVIAVVADTPNRGLQESPLPMLEVPSTVAPRNGGWVALRMAGDADSMIPVMEREMSKVAPGVAFYWIKSLDASLEAGVAAQRFTLWLLSIFAVIGTTLLVIGLYGVMSYAVMRRTYEMGVRIALGASTTAILRLITSRGLALVAIGVVFGAFGTIIFSPVLRSQLGDMSPYDPAAYLAAGALIVATTCAAIFIPGTRAVRINPVNTLRHD